MRSHVSRPTSSLYLWKTSKNLDSSVFVELLECNLYLNSFYRGLLET
jgi:hypothetical protein